MSYAGCRRRCSQASSVLWGRLTSRVRSSPACSRRIHGADRDAPSRPDAGSPSSCAESLRACMGSSTARGPTTPRDSDATGLAFGLWGRPRRPDLSPISRLNTQPTRSPADACRTPLRTPHHGSGPAWVATALPYGSRIHYSPPVTGASPVGALSLFTMLPGVPGPAEAGPPPPAKSARPFGADTTAGGVTSVARRSAPSRGAGRR